MKHKLLIEFTSAEDLQWAERLIAQAQKFTSERTGTPLSGARASILLCALGRAKKVARK
jgi:hypothetical protein